jgi:NADPH:quinone reductase-like Zn-dependent oxidoreductase
LGARYAIDYTKEDFTQNDKTYDVIMDTAGTAPYSRSKKSLKEGGRLLLVLGGFSDMLQMPFVSIMNSRKVIAGPVEERVEDLHFLAELAEAGEFKPVIDRSYPFEKMVEAHQYVDKGHKRGNVVISLE